MFATAPPPPPLPDDAIGDGVAATTVDGVAIVEEEVFELETLDLIGVSDKRIPSSFVVVSSPPPIIVMGDLFPILC